MSKYLKCQPSTFVEFWCETEKFFEEAFSDT